VEVQRAEMDRAILRLALHKALLRWILLMGDSNRYSMWGGRNVDVRRAE